MRRSFRTIIFAGVGLLINGPISLLAQANPTATEPLQIEAFGGISGIDTGLASGKNIGLTAGVDFNFLPFHALHPALEFRGTYPLDKGSIDSQKNVLGGIKVAAHLGRLSPYGDFLLGRGEINYGSGFQVPQTPFFYTQSSSNVLSPGGGTYLKITNQLALDFDFQVQRYSTPVTNSGHLYAKSTTVGVVYRFKLTHHAR